MTAVFRSCLPRFYSNTNQSISDEYLSNKTNSIECLSIISNQNPTTNSSFYKEKQSNQINLLSSSPKQISPLKNTKKRGPRYSRINEKSQSLLTRLISTIFGNYITPTNKKSRLPSKSTIKKQFEENEQILNSLITLLTQIESNVKITSNNNHSIDKEQARNNNRIDDTSSSNSNDNYHHKSKISKRYTKKYTHNKKRQSENETLSSCSITSQSRRKMVDNQQQTQLYPTKINIGTSTQLSEPSWLDIMREDQTTINAWARIRRRLKPNQQKDILRALMIICANLFDVPLENKHI